MTAWGHVGTLKYRELCLPGSYHHQLQTSSKAANTTPAIHLHMENSMCPSHCVGVCVCVSAAGHHGGALSLLYFQ